MITSQTLFNSVGGEDVFNRIVHSFYVRMRSGDFIDPMHPSDDWEGVEERLRMFLIQYWGGSHTYSGQCGHPRLCMRHMSSSIDEAERDRWLEIMSASLVGIPDGRLPRPQREALWDHVVQVADMLIDRLDAQQELGPCLVSSPTAARQRTRT